jgi:hypothetical protein
VGEDAGGSVVGVDVEGDVDVHDAETVVGCPVEVGREGVDLFVVLDGLGMG